MRRSGRVPVSLFALVLSSLLVGPNLGRTSAHLGFGDSPFLTTVVEPIGVAASPGVLYVTRPFCGNAKKLLKFVPDTFPNFQEISLPLHGITNDCFEDYVAIAGPKDDTLGGFPSPTKARDPTDSTKSSYFTNYVYVTQGNNIVEISNTGVVLNTNFVPGGILGCGSDRTGITFDHVGGFGYNMIVTCVTGKVYKITRNNTVPGDAGTGTATLIADVAAFSGLASVQIEGPDVSPTIFPGQILVAATSHDRVLAISAGGVVTRIDARWRSPEGVNVIPAAKCRWGTLTATYFTVIFSPGPGSSTIYQFPTGDFSGLSGKALVTSESTAGIGLLEPFATGFRIRAFHNVGTHHEGSAFVDCDVPTVVTILAKLGTPQGINPDKKGITKFAILSTPAFDATNPNVVIQADGPPAQPGCLPVGTTNGIQDCLTFGFKGTEFSVHYPCSVFDVNKDGRNDLLCDANVESLGLATAPLDANGRYTGPLIVKGKGVPGGDDFEGAN